jgi:predicted small metal-binding protein
MTKMLSTEQWGRKTAKEAQETVATTQEHAQPSHTTPTTVMNQGSNNNKG